MYDLARSSIRSGLRGLGRDEAYCRGRRPPCARDRPVLRSASTPGPRREGDAADHSWTAVLPAGA
eukprot:9196235-Heterocapsa_arctica.AAC.1